MAPSLEESLYALRTSHRVSTSLGVSQCAQETPQIVPFSSLRNPHPISTSLHSVPTPLHPSPSLCTVAFPHPSVPRGPQTPFFNQKQQAQLLEQQRKATAERERQLEALLADERSSYAQNLQALEAKMQAEAPSAQRELDRALEAKLREHSELLQRGFNERAALRRELSNNDKKQELATNAFDAVRATCDLARVLKLAKLRGTAA